MRWALSDSTGAITAISPDPVEGWVEVGDEVELTTHYLDGAGAPRPYTTESAALKFRWPGIGWEWHGRRGVWVDARGIALLRSSRLVEIEVERERRNELPVQYAGSMFDADATAQRNVSAWLAMVNAGQDPPTGFFWRDYDNVDHPAGAAFITGLAAAITLRGTLLYQTSWAKKAEIATMSVEQLKAYDPTSGW